MYVGCSTQEAEARELRERGLRETPASTFDREFRFCVPSKTGIARRRTGYWFAGGISVAGSASWIASCTAAFAFPWTLRDIPVRSLLSKRGGGGRRVRSWCETVSHPSIVAKGWVKKFCGHRRLVVKVNVADYADGNKFLTPIFQILLTNIAVKERILDI